MLYVCFENSNNPVAWKLGTNFPIHRANVPQVAWIEADEDELDFICHGVCNVPMSTRRVNSQRWFGDHAKFIVDIIRVISESKNKLTEPLDQPKHFEI